MTENRFTIFITIILAILTFLLAWNYYQEYTKSKREEQEKTIFEKKIDTNKINRVIIYNPSRIELTKVGEFWFVNPINDIANEYMIEDIISNIYQPAISDIIDFDKNYYSQFFSNPIDIYLFYTGELYHIQRGVKNDFTSETYLWIDLPVYKEKIYVVNYWDFNYLDKGAQEFRMKKVLNIDQAKVDKILVNGSIIYKEEVTKNGKKKNKDEGIDKVYYWKLSDGSFASKEYINSLFGILNNYDFKYSIDSYSPLFLNKLSKVSDIKIYSQGREYMVQIFSYKPEEYVVKCSYRKPLLVYSKVEINDFLSRKLIEKKIFSYYIESFDDFDRIWISDSRAKFEFKKKEGKWYSLKNEEKTAQINLLINSLKNIEYKQRFLINPLNTKYELYSFEFFGKGKKRQRFYLYNTDYLSYGREVYKIEPFVYILKDLLK